MRPGSRRAPSPRLAHPAATALKMARFAAALVLASPLAAAAGTSDAAEPSSSDRATAGDELPAPVVDFSQADPQILGPAELAGDAIAFALEGLTPTLYIFHGDALASEWQDAACVLHRTERRPFMLDRSAELSRPCAALFTLHEDTLLLARGQGTRDDLELRFELPATLPATVHLLRAAPTEPAGARYTTNFAVSGAARTPAAGGSAWLFDGRWKPVMIDPPPSPAVIDPPLSPAVIDPPPSPAVIDPPPSPAVIDSLPSPVVAPAGPVPGLRASGRLDSFDLRSPAQVPFERAVDAARLTDRLGGVAAGPLLLVAPVVRGDGSLRTWVLTGEPAPATAPPSRPAAFGPMEAWCGVGAPARTRPWRYALCVDLSDPAAPRTMHRTSRPGADPALLAGRAHLYSRRDVDLLVLHPEGTEAIVETRDDDGAWQAARITEPGDRASSGGVVLTQVALAPFTRPGEVQLSVEIAKGRAVVASSSRTFAVEHRFLGAVRIGVSTTFAPSQLRYELRPLDPTDTTIGTTADRPGAGAVELLLGYSWFIAPMPVSAPSGRPSGRIGFGWYAGAALLSGSPGGLEPLSGLFTGPELQIGPSLAVTALLGLRRTDQINPNYRLGQVLPRDFDLSVALEPGAAFAFGLAVNLSPPWFLTPL